MKDSELKYGLSVTGVISEHKIWTNAGAQVGDVLLLTKSLGTGIASTALKRDACDPELWAEAQASMLELNGRSAEALKPLDVHAVTDVTGFGLAGHAWEMAKASGVGLEIDVEALPVFSSARLLASRGFVTGGAKSNRAYVGDGLRCEGVSDEDVALVLDPQTSGGLLVALPEAEAERFMAASGARPIGRVLAGDARVALA